MKKQTQAQTDRAYDRTCARMKKEAEDTLVSAAMRVLGKRTSPKKKASSKKNGRKGGRPAKPRQDGTVGPQTEIQALPAPSRSK